MSHSLREGDLELVQILSTSQADLGQNFLLLVSFPHVKGPVYLMSRLKDNPFPNKPWFLSVCSTSLLKTLWEKEKLPVISPFPTVSSVLRTFCHFHQI